jgi:hypothetical protein
MAAKLTCNCGASGNVHDWECSTRSVLVPQKLVGGSGVYVGFVEPVDRVDSRGNLREHLTSTGEKTLCGLDLYATQKPAGNAPCRRCVQLTKEGT